MHGNDISLCVGLVESIIRKHLRSKQRSYGTLYDFSSYCSVVRLQKTKTFKQRRGDVFPLQKRDGAKQGRGLPDGWPVSVFSLDRVRNGNINTGFLAHHLRSLQFLLIP